MRSALLACIVVASLMAGCTAASPSAAPSSPSTPPASAAPATSAPASSVEPTDAPTPSPTPAATPPPTSAPGPLSVSGTITDAAGNPLAGLYVMAAGRSGTGPETTTAADGTFSLELARGVWYLTTVTPVGQVFFGENGMGPAKDSMFEIGDTVHPPMNLTVPAGTQVSGKAYDYKGRPIKNEMLTADSSEVAAVATTDGKGRFSMLLLPGKYMFAVVTTNGTLAWKQVTVGKKPMTVTLRGGG